MALPLQLPPDGYLRLSFEGAADVTGTAVQSWDLTSIPRAVRATEGFDRSLLVLARPLTAGLMSVDPTVSFVYDSDGVPTELVLTVTAGGAADEVALDVWCLHSVIGAVANESKAYFFSPPGGAGAVTSVFGRVGAVVAALNDYAASLIQNDSGVAGAQVSDALNTLAAAITALTSDDIANASGVAGATVTAALNTLAAAITALSGATKFATFPAETNGQNDEHRVRSLGSGGNFNFNFRVPPDFTTLVSLRLEGKSRTVTNAAASITATGWWGTTPGGGPLTNTQVAALVESFTAGVNFGYDISGAFPGLAANDEAAIEIDHNGIGGTLDYYRVILGYT